MSALGSQSDNAPLTPEQILAHPAVQALLADPKLSQRSAADRYNVGPTTLSRWLRSLRQQAPESLPSRLSQGRHRSSLKAHPPISADVPSRFKRGRYSYPVYAYARAGAADVTPQFDGDPLDFFESGVEIRKYNGNLPPFAVRVRGHAMTDPSRQYHFPEGTDVLVNPNIEPRNGDFVAVMDTKKYGGLIIKQIFAKAGAGGAVTRTLVSLNRNVPDIPLDGIRYQLMGVVVDSMLPSYRR